MYGTVAIMLLMFILGIAVGLAWPKTITPTDISNPHQQMEGKGQHWCWACSQGHGIGYECPNVERATRMLERIHDGDRK